MDTLAGSTEEQAVAARLGEVLRGVVTLTTSSCREDIPWASWKVSDIPNGWLPAKVLAAKAAL